ncbi:hypothetical protein VNO78_03672 [Psophocarpus tetragonolobus]|uniref:SCP domain-containing protein n=1 Tax=Psophocarpus tetragonolobus TaxID=3891 RepID=A0AAN9T4R2_PSOTE
MGLHTISMVGLIGICILVATSRCQMCKAQNSPQDYLKAHNSARSQVGVGPMRWDATVASYAQRYLNTLKGNCKMVHSRGPYGENLAWSSADLTGVAAVKMWVAEKPKYDYNSNTCLGGECRHYTQVVWRNSLRLGCAKVRCNDARSTIISCNYDPPGNYINQRPYDITPFQLPFTNNNAFPVPLQDN